MTATASPQSVSAPPSGFPERAVLYHLIAQEWRYCRGPVVNLGVVWLIGLWIMMLFNHPGWLVAIGLWHVLFISPVQAGRDIIDGTEEFSFALPPGRTPLYVARMIPGLVFLTVAGLSGWLAIEHNLPQCVWSVVFSGGLTEPFPPVTGMHWYAMAVLLPCAGHAVAFALAANAKSRAAVHGSGIAGIIAAGAVMLAGFLLEDLLWQEINGFLAGPALLVTAVLALLGGHQAYRRKEATGSGGVAGTGGRSGLVWIIAIVLILLLFLSAIFVSYRRTAVRSSEMNRLEQERMRLQVSQPPQPAPTPAGHDQH